MKIQIAIAICFVAFYAEAQTILPLYNGSIPNSKDVPNEETSMERENGILIISKVTEPTLTVYLPVEENATGKAVIICPGGGYTILAASHEGSDVAEEFAKNGIAAFVLKYRLPSDSSMVDKSIGPLQDAQRAIQLVRENATEFNIDSNKIGMMGFSAGGHLAATAGTRFQNAVIDNPEQTNLRPDFLILVYPVINFDPEIGHSGSAKNLLGENPTQERLDYYSNEKHVTNETPSTYLVHAKNDNVSVRNSYVFEEALKEHHVNVATTYFEDGGHGFGMHNPTTDEKWMDSVVEWVKKIDD